MTKEIGRPKGTLQFEPYFDLILNSMSNWGTIREVQRRYNDLCPKHAMILSNKTMKIYIGLLNNRGKIETQLIGKIKVYRRI